MMPPQPSKDTFNEEIDTIRKNVATSLEAYDQEKQGQGGDDQERKEKAMHLILEEITKITQHETKPKTVIPPAPKREGSIDEIDPLKDVEESDKKEMTALEEVAYTDGIFPAVQQALKKGGLYYADLLQGMLTIKAYRQFVDQNIV